MPNYRDPETLLLPFQEDEAARKRRPPPRRWSSRPHKERNQCLRLREAELLMHKPDRYLMQMRTSTGPEWFVVPGGRVRSDDAAKIIGRPDVVPYDNGLFPGIKQSWKLV